MKVANIPTSEFNQLIKTLRRAGWKKTFEYDNIDSWIDFGEVILEKDGCALVFKWDNWSEGEVERPEQVLRTLGVVKDA